MGFTFVSYDGAHLCNKCMFEVCQQVFWLHEAAVSFQPARNTVITQNKRIHYDYLVVACGLAIRFQDIKGLPGDALTAKLVAK